jgi:outer membrane protein assembly factor BamB
MKKVDHKEKKMRTIRYITLIMVIPLLLLTCTKKDVQEKAVDVEGLSWPIFRGDPMLSGTADSELPEKLELKWSFETGSWIIGSPVVGSGRVYIGSTDGKLYAIDLRDGTKVWEFDSGDDIEASPLLLEGSVYVGNLSGEFFSLDARSGQFQWKYTCDSSIYGSANWIMSQDDKEPWILVGCYDNRLYCFNGNTGELIWAYETDNYINGAPSTDGTHVVFGGCDELLHILSLPDGKKKGEVWAGSYIPGSAALKENRAYLGHYDNQLVCIDINEEKIIWKYEDKDHPNSFFSSPAVGEDHVLIGSRDGYLHCVDRETGEQIWTFRTRDEIDSSPVIAGSKVVVGSLDGRLYIVDLRKGKEIWSYEIGAPLFGCPAITGGFILIGSDDGRVYAFGEKS